MKLILAVGVFIGLGCSSLYAQDSPEQPQTEECGPSSCTMDQGTADDDEEGPGRA